MTSTPKSPETPATEETAPAIVAETEETTPVVAEEEPQAHGYFKDGEFTLLEEGEEAPPAKPILSLTARTLVAISKQIGQGVKVKNSIARLGELEFEADDETLPRDKWGGKVGLKAFRDALDEVREQIAASPQEKGVAIANELDASPLYLEIISTVDGPSSDTWVANKWERVERAKELLMALYPVVDGKWGLQQGGKGCPPAISAIVQAACKLKPAAKPKAKATPNAKPANEKKGKRKFPEDSVAAVKVLLENHGKHGAVGSFFGILAELGIDTQQGAKKVKANRRDPKGKPHGKKNDGKRSYTPKPVNNVADAMRDALDKKS